MCSNGNFEKWVDCTLTGVKRLTGGEKYTGVCIRLKGKGGKGEQGVKMINRGVKKGEKSMKKRLHSSYPP